MTFALPMHRMFPRDYPLAQQAHMDSECFAHRREAQPSAGIVVRQNPALGIDVKPPRGRPMREHTLLIHVDSISQQREHQALLTGQAVAA